MLVSRTTMFSNVDDEGISKPICCFDIGDIHLGGTVQSSQQRHLVSHMLLGDHEIPEVQAYQTPSSGLAVECYDERHISGSEQ